MKDDFDLIIKPPGWITKYGISALFTILLILVIIISHVPFSDIISGPARIEPSLSSIEINAKDMDKIEVGQGIFINISGDPNMQLKGKVEKLKITNNEPKSLRLDVIVTLDSSEHARVKNVNLPTEIMGEGHIIIGEKSLLQRLFSSF